MLLHVLTTCGISPQIIYVFRKTGRLASRTPEERDEAQRLCREYLVLEDLNSMSRH